MLCDCERVCVYRSVNYGSIGDQRICKILSRPRSAGRLMMAAPSVGEVAQGNRLARDCSGELAGKGPRRETRWPVARQL